MTNITRNDLPLHNHTAQNGTDYWVEKDADGDGMLDVYSFRDGPLLLTTRLDLSKKEVEGMRHILNFHLGRDR